MDNRIHGEKRKRRNQQTVADFLTKGGKITKCPSSDSNAGEWAWPDKQVAFGWYPGRGSK